MFQYLRKNLHLLVKKFLKYDSIVKPLSHQGGALAAFYNNAERRGKRGTNDNNAVATRWELRRTPWEILERQGLAILLDMLKTNAVTLGVLI